MRSKTLQRFAVTLFILISSASLRADIPELAKLNAEAEQGDARAQFEFARHFSVGDKDWGYWLRRSAAQGNGQAEDELAWTLNWQNFSTYFPEESMRAAHLKEKGPSMRDALLVAASAADKGFARSRILLACAYANGYLLPRDQAEAYMWITLSRADGAAEEFAAASTRDRLLKEIPMDAVQEGERRVKRYHPANTVARVKAQLLVPSLKLTSVASVAGKKVALINGTKCRLGEDASLNLANDLVTLHIDAVESGSVVIFSLPPESLEYEMQPGAKATVKQH